jgi:hypothetical protein
MSIELLATPMGKLPTQEVSHTGPLLVIPSQQRVIMARIIYRPNLPYLVQVWVPDTKRGVQMETNHIVEALWELTLPLLQVFHVNVEAVLQDLKCAILTLAGEMDTKTNDAQRLMVELGTPSLIQLPPGETT